MIKVACRIMLPALLWAFAVLLPQPAAAQLELSGSATFEVSVGGDDSRFIVNQINNSFRRLHLGIHKLNFFIFSEISENLFFNSRIQWDTWGSGRLNNPRITLAMLSYAPENSVFSIDIGRYISPFGLYARRQLDADNTFVNVPLVYGYFVNVSEFRGFWNSAGNTGTYGTGEDVGLPTIYWGGYHSGLRIRLDFVPDIFSWDVALANAAPTSPLDFTTFDNGALITRIGLQPLIYWQQGFSMAYGTFMERNEINQAYSIGELQEFRQLLLGSDALVAIGHFELSGELVYTRWTVPAFTGGEFRLNQDMSMTKYSLESIGAYLDLKIEPPFLAGTYLAFRYETMIFPEYDPPETISTPIALNPWDRDVTQLSAAVGLKLARDVLIKLAYSYMEIPDINPQPDLYTVRGTLTVGF